MLINSLMAPWSETVMPLKPHWSRRTSFSSRIRGRRGAVQRVQGYHHRAAAGIKPGFIRRHIVVEQALRAHVDRIVLFPALHRAVGAKCLTLVITE